ncbi:MAG: cyclophilin type peptidyl-prolyl cis-trans isomerase/CLD-domain-containing protein [Monoraphidium minutum]|nr:MAG: cyclophilin type peptidyl-prolyl cis-trans isomerase/CLD-domain-containing protein [Monoraphidium minutum]
MQLRVGSRAPFTTRHAPVVAARPAAVRCQALKPGKEEGQGPDLLQRCALGLLAAATAVMPLTIFEAPAYAKLTAGDPIKNASAILRNALPVDNKPIRTAQRSLEAITEELRVPGAKSLGPISRSVRAAQAAVTSGRASIVSAFAPAKKAEGEAALARLEASLTEFMALIEAKDKQLVPIKQRECLEYVGQVEEAMVTGLTFDVPAEWANRPLLKGRATLEMQVNIRETPEGPQSPVLTIVLDGYNAPVSAGQFLELVQMGFYDGMDVQRADGFVVQTGDPDGPATGYVDPATNKLRIVPLEIKVAGDKAPIYEDSLEDLGRFNETPVLPFNAYGTLAWARAEFDNNSASSQVFFLLKESELTPTGANLLDGRYAVFGYVTANQDSLGTMKVGDKIKYIKCVKGCDLLANAGGKKAAPAPAPAAEEAAAPDN